MGNEVRFARTTEEIEIQPKDIRSNEMFRLASPLVAIIAEYFKDPQVQAEYAAWKAERYAGGTSQ